MNVELHLDETEQATLVELAKASGKDVEQYLHDLVRVQLEAEREDTSPAGDFAAWRRRLQACIDRHPGVGHVDTSRAAMYGEHR